MYLNSCRIIIKLLHCESIWLYHVLCHKTNGMPSVFIEWYCSADFTSVRPLCRIHYLLSSRSYICNRLHIRPLSDVFAQAVHSNTFGTGGYAYLLKISKIRFWRYRTCCQISVFAIFSMDCDCTAKQYKKTLVDC